MPIPSALERLRKLALGFPETVEGIVCERSSLKARNKAFAFMGLGGSPYDVMLKLRDSLPEAAELAAREPERYKVGGHGWVTFTFDGPQAPPDGLLERWIAESFRLLAPKGLAAEFDAPKKSAKKSAANRGSKKTPAKKKMAKKRPAR